MTVSCPQIQHLSTEKCAKECKIECNSGNAIWDLLMGSDYSGALKALPSPGSNCSWDVLLLQKHTHGSCLVQVPHQQRASSLGGTWGTSGSSGSFWRVPS